MAVIQSEGQLVLVHAGLEGPRSTFARRFTTVHDKRDLCSCHETRKPSLAPVVGQFSTLIGSSLVPYLYLHGSSTARSFLEGATRARVEVAAPKHAALSRWARDPRPSRRWPGRHPPPSNHVPVAPSHDVNARVDVADRDAPDFVPIRTSYPSPTRRQSGWPGRCRRSGEPGAHTGHTQRVAQIALVVTNQSRQFNEYQARTLLICAMRSILPAMLGAFRTSTRPRAPLGHARSREARSRWRAGCRGGWSIRYATSRYPDRLPRGWIPGRPRRRAPQSRGRPRARGYRW